MLRTLTAVAFALLLPVSLAAQPVAVNLVVAVVSQQPVLFAKLAVSAHLKTLGITVTWVGPTEAKLFAPEAKLYVVLWPDVSKICQSPKALGCISPGAPNAYIRSGLPPAALAKVIAHELGHLAGFEHNDGTFMAAQWENQ